MAHETGLPVNFAYSDRCHFFARCCHMVLTAFPSIRGPAAVSIRALWCRMLLYFQMYKMYQHAQGNNIIVGVLANGGSR